MYRRMDFVLILILTIILTLTLPSSRPIHHLSMRHIRSSRGALPLEEGIGRNWQGGTGGVDDVLTEVLADCFIDFDSTRVVVSVRLCHSQTRNHVRHGFRFGFCYPILGLV